MRSNTNLWVKSFSESKKYIAYCRVSSIEQAARNLSIPSQIDQIDQYAIQNWLQIVKYFREEHSAYQWKRTVFYEMLKELKTNKQVRGLIIFKYDRLSRNIDDFSMIDKLVRENGQEIISVTEPMLNNYLWRYLIRDMQNRAVLYSEELGFRVKLGIRKKLQNGWFIWWPTPFWFDNIEGQFVPNKDAEIVKWVFETYAEMHYGYKELRKMMKDKFNLKYCSSARIELILTNSLYYWYKIKEWNLSNEEYMFFGAKWPWRHVEEYRMNFITPIISRELFLRCEEIRKGKIRYEHTRKWWPVKFPKVFTCICGRKMSRDDKKNIRYLKCPKLLTAKFPTRCKQRYQHLKPVEKQLIWIFEKLIGTTQDRENARKFIFDEMNNSEHDKKKRVIKLEEEISQLESKKKDITESFIGSFLDKESFEWAITQISEKSKDVKLALSLASNDRLLLVWGNRFLHFLKVLDQIDLDIHISDAKQKSSKVFWYFHKIHSNSIVDGDKIVTYWLNPPFDIVANHWICYNQGVQDLNL